MPAQFIGGGTLVGRDSRCEVKDKQAADFRSREEQRKGILEPPEAKQMVVPSHARGHSATFGFRRLGSCSTGSAALDRETLRNQATNTESCLGRL